MAFKQVAKTNIFTIIKHFYQINHKMVNKTMKHPNKEKIEKLI